MNRKRMRAAVLTGPGKIQIQEHPIPEPGDGAVRVRLEGCGLCGSNLAPWEGRPWLKYPFAPGAPGHEGWGIIDFVGPKVSEFSPGDRVAMLSYHAFADYDVANQDAVLRLPPALNDQPFPGEALGCAFNVFRRCHIKEGQNVAVLGVGFLGALLTSLALQAGANVIAISRRPFALEIAEKLGATTTLCIADHARIVTDIQKLTKGCGCDCVIEATGYAEPLDLAGQLTRTRGRLVIAGYHQEPRNVNMQLWNWRGLDVINAHERETCVYMQGMREAVESITNGDIDPKPLYTHTFPLEQITAAFEALEDRPNRFLKALIRM